MVCHKIPIIVQFVKIEHTDEIPWLTADVFKKHYVHFTPKQTVIGLNYDIEKMFYPLCKHSLKSRYGVDLFICNQWHLNRFKACLVWYYVLLCLSDILDCILIKPDTLSSDCMSSVKFKMDLFYELGNNERREKPEPKEQQFF